MKNVKSLTKACARRVEKTNPRKMTLKGKPVYVKDASRKVRVPNDFPWKLLATLITDCEDVLCLDDSQPCRALEPSYLEGFKRAIENRDVKSLMAEISLHPVQRILDDSGGRKDVFFAVYQICALVKKYPFEAKEAKAKALRTFQMYERRCRLYNTENVNAVVKLNSSHPDYLSIIEEIRADIRGLIGTGPNVQRVIDCASHGPGSAVGFEGMEGKVTPFFKWSNLPYTVSPSTYPLAVKAIESDPRWIGALLDHYRVSNNIDMWKPIAMSDFWSFALKVVDYCRYSSVPKTALTERAIALEPTLNVFLQLGVDKVFKARLARKWGVDLTSQKRNQEFAHKSSIDGMYSTLDLEGASEMVTRAVCLLLLPSLWYDLLDDLRSKNIKFPGSNHLVPLAKMSAMGNGFTFALETLIFTAICRCALRRKGFNHRDLSVYGDDIIVPTGATSFVKDLLKLFGFSINDDKSFVEGPFRESCGSDFYSGTAVRPLFLKSTVETVNDLFYVMNSLYAIDEDYWQFGLSFKRTRLWLYKFIPIEFRDVYGPRSESLDTYRFSNAPIGKLDGMNGWHWVISPCATSFSDRLSNSTFFFRKLMNNLKGTPVNSLGFAVSSEGSSFDVTLRDVVRYKRQPRLVWY